MVTEQDNIDRDWRWLDLTIVLVLVGAVLMIALISAGAFDPKPVGELVDTFELNEIQVTGKQSRIDWIEEPTPPGDISLRMTAALADGELDSAYGLVIGNADAYLATAFSPTGYVSFWQQEGQRLQKIIPWRTWPHVNRGLEENELWLDVVDGQLVSIRTNREILWQGEQPLAARQVGLWAETFASPAVFDFQQLEIFGDSPAN